ncbi:aromatic amino acid ammonia-lyase [Prauserella muralis]|uniref:Histidine ammonia-lyase n=1 Tax=Prauserella muralis TaxID=588067 RepID=A0A2V4B207_9PSEU|nr:aromatic amino acid ammonia-lyase [Prauserella muralis]PXY22595.1 histidine ammonia-lyase [Prauserella muralis]TWE28295.1 histidine ammonia-lyase [Prauserella muralis]
MPLTASSSSAVVLDGRSLTGEQVVRVARWRAPVAVAESGRQAAERSWHAARSLVTRRPVYGRTTGVGANRLETVDSEDAAEHGVRLLRSHAGGLGDLLSEEEVRAMLVVRLNQLLAGGSGVRPEVVDALAGALNSGCYPAVHEFGAIGTGDLTALSETGLTLLGELDWLGAAPGPEALTLDSGDALAFISSNALTIGIAELAWSLSQHLLQVTHLVAALSFIAVDGSQEAYAETVHNGRPHPGQIRAAERMRTLLGPALRPPARIQDPFGFRCFPQIHGPALDAADRLHDVLAVEANAAAENPLISSADDAAYHHGGFHCAYLTHALDGIRLSLLDTAHLSTARLAALIEPKFTGLRPFLAAGPSGSSGVMILEYSANSALADVRTLAAPAGLGNAVVSRGLEEHSSFAFQSARQSLRSLTAFRLVLACELVTAVRALRQRGLEPRADTPLRAAYALAADKLDPDMTDRSLSLDVELGAILLDEFARL